MVQFFSLISKIAKYPTDLVGRHPLHSGRWGPGPRVELIDEQTGESILIYQTKGTFKVLKCESDLCYCLQTNETGIDFVM